MRIAMLEAKKRILEYETAERLKQPLKSEGFWGQLVEAISGGISNSIDLTVLENQLNALIVEDLAYL